MHHWECGLPARKRPRWPLSQEAGGSGITRPRRGWEGEIYAVRRRGWGGTPLIERGQKKEARAETRAAWWLSRVRRGPGVYGREAVRWMSSLRAVMASSCWAMSCAVRSADPRFISLRP